MKVFLGQINPRVGDLKGNRTRLMEAIQQGKQEGADLIVFPEMALTGYPPQDLLFLPHFIKETWQLAQELGALSEGTVLFLGMPRTNPSALGKPLFNSCAVFADGMFLDFYDKQLLPSYDVFNEQRYFEPGKNPYVIEIKGKRVGITICEDIWQRNDIYYTNPVEKLANEKVDVVVNLSASPYFLGKGKLRQEVAKSCAMQLRAHVFLVNQAGANDSLIFDGTSQWILPDGTLGAELPHFKVATQTIDMDHCGLFTSPPLNPQEELFGALTLGVKDYCQKSGINKIILGLSGGIDSSVVAVIAKAALGKENVTGVMMPSKYSSASSIVDAKQLAKNLDIQLLELPIRRLHVEFLSLLGLPGGNLTEENIQARIRGVILMALANETGAIVLNTGNKSELAVGYATLYGDMCGALSTIGDLTKREVYQLAAWINKDQEIIPDSALSKAPSAELRPEQQDSDTLPPYSILDAIVVDYVENHMSSKEISNKNLIPIEVVNYWVGHIDRNEFKRHQAPPILKVTRKAFQAGRHYPIVFAKTSP